MTTYAIAIGGALALFLVGGLIRHRTKLAATFNAVQAEITLGFIELIPKNPFCKQLRDAVISVIRRTEGNGTSESTCIDRFNQAPRFRQLNVVALALGNLGHGPLLTHRTNPWGWWKIRRPLLAKIPEHRILQQIIDKARVEQDVNIDLPSRQLRIVGEHLLDVRGNRLEEHPLAEPIPTDIIEGVKLYMDAAQLATRAIERREIEIGIFEVEARMRMPAFVKASPATKRDFLKLRERLQVMFRLKSPHASNELEPQRDVVEALIERRENFSGETATRNDQAWKASPEYKTLMLVNHVAALCRSGANEKDALRKLKDKGFLTEIEHTHAETALGSVAEGFFREIKDVPEGHVVYTVSFARDINWMKNRTPMRMANN